MLSSQPLNYRDLVVDRDNFFLFKLYISKCQTEQAISCPLPVKWIIYHSSFGNPFFLFLFFSPHKLRKFYVINSMNF